MYIDKVKILTFAIIMILSNCSEPKESSFIPYQKYLDGNIRSLDILNDTLFVASEDQGVIIYKINDSEEFELDSLFSSNEVGVPVTLDIAENSRSLIILDDYNHTYIGKVDFFSSNSFLSSITCDDYQRQSTFIDYLDRPIEIITPFRHKPTQNEVDQNAWNTSFLHKVTFDQAAYDFSVYAADCSDTLFKYLNYDIEDVYYNNDKLYLADPDADLNSIVILDHNIDSDSFTPHDTLYFDSKPLTVKANENYILVGLDDNDGCYIKLLDTSSQNNSNFNIASGYTIRDIQILDNYIVLSAGYDGALIYEWNDSGGISDDDLVVMLGGIYAYKTFIYNDNIIMGTKDGLQIYKMER